jgi:hypothetical protein
MKLSVSVNVDKQTPHLRVDMRLPHPVTDDTRVLVFAEGELAEKARAAGATIVGSVNLIPQVCFRREYMTEERVLRKFGSRTRLFVMDTLHWHDLFNICNVFALCRLECCLIYF